MSRKVFELIAAVIFNLPPTIQLTVAHAFADMLRSTNQRFDRERFLRACTRGAK